MSFANSNYWIGLTDLQAEGTFVWESGQPLSTDVAAHWGTNQPDNYRQQQHCVKIGTNSGTMEDWQCTGQIFKAPFVCQLRGRVFTSRCPSKTQLWLRVG